MSALQVTPVRTPNPNSIKFTTNVTLNTGPARSYYSTAAAAADPLARRLFELPGVTGVMLLRDFCTVNQDGSQDWADLIARIDAILHDALAAT